MWPTFPMRDRPRSGGAGPAAHQSAIFTAFCEIVANEGQRGPTRANEGQRGPTRARGRGVNIRGGPGIPDGCEASRVRGEPAAPLELSIRDPADSRTALSRGDERQIGRAAALPRAPARTR